MVRCAKFSPKADYVLSGNSIKEIHIFNFKKKSLIFYNKLKGTITSLFWNFNGNKYIIGTSSKNEIKIFKFKSKKEIKTLNIHSFVIYGVFLLENIN